MRGPRPLAAQLLAGAAVLTLVASALPAPPADADLKRAFFSNTQAAEGRRYTQSDYQALPGAQDAFDPEKDQQVYFYVVLNSPDPVKVRGVVKNPAGETHLRFQRDAPQIARGGVTSANYWRWLDWRWPTEKMRGKAGKWVVELELDGKPAGSYAFTMK